MNKIKIGWIEYKIQEVDSHIINEADGEYAGRVLHGTREIRINKDYSQEEKNETLIHEILHCINKYIGSDLTEYQVSGLSNMLFQVLIDNNLWRKDAKM